MITTGEGLFLIHLISPTDDTFDAAPSAWS